MNRLAPVPRVDMDPELKRWLSALRDAFVAEVPTGAVVAAFLSDDVGTDWLVLDGRSVSKRTFAGLYAVIGGAYGETATEFTLPTVAPTVGTAWLIKT